MYFLFNVKDNKVCQKIYIAPHLFPYLDHGYKILHCLLFFHINSIQKDS